MDLFGLTGGIMEHRSALLASRGFAPLSIAYMLHEDLPRNHLALDLNYFLKAFDQLLNHPNVDKANVGIVVTCARASFATVIAERRPQMLDPRDHENLTPLLMTLTNEQEECIDILLTAGADINAPDR